MGFRGLALASIVALAAYLRWFNIGQGSLWIDEATSISLARLPWGRFVRTLWQHEANMALYHGLLRAWIHLGDGETVLRGFSAVCGTAAVAVLYDLGRRLSGARAGLLAAALLSVNMFHIWFSQEVRSYALVVLLVSVSLRFFLEGVEQPHKTWAWFLYVLTSVLAVYVHFFAALVLAAQWLAVGARGLRIVGLRRLALIAVGLGLPLAPLVVFVLWRDQGQIRWIPPLSVDGIFRALLALCGFSRLMLVVLLVGLVSCLKDLPRGDEAAWRMRLLGLGVVFPIATVAVVSLFKSLFFFRYFAVCLPAAVLLTAVVLSPVRVLSKPTRAAVNALAAITLGLCLRVTAGYYSWMPNWGGDWRSATEYVLANRQAGDGIVFYVSSGLDVFRYYQDRLPSSRGPIPMPDVVFPAASELAFAHLAPTYPALKASAQGHPRLWLVLHQKAATDFPAPFLKRLRLIREEQFTPAWRGPEMSLTVALYQAEASP